jgi:uncharacterized protein YyaL (SSP411 family)
MRRLLSILLLSCVPLSAETMPPGGGGLQWREWNEDAFEEARKKTRPIALFIVCHWARGCEVLRQRTLRDAALVQVLNERFIPVRVDRDRRPDIDVRYQEAVRALSKASGWPLVAFLTPSGEVLLGGTFWRLDDDYVRAQPGLGTVVAHMARNWDERSRELTLKAEEFEKSLAAGTPESAAGDVPADVLVRAAKGVRASLLPPAEWRGPRFPQPCGVELLLADHAENGSRESLAAAQAYLDRMLEGAIYDRLNGGFQRFALDREWRRPRWEKLLPLNAEMLRVLVKAFQVTGNSAYREAAERTLSWAMATLADRERGGFGASQAGGRDADHPGDFYTWSVGEVERVLSGETRRVFCAAYDIRERGDWPEQSPYRNSLFVAVASGKLAEDASVPANRVGVVLADALRRMSVAAKARRAPPVDRTILVDANARMVSALLLAAETLERPQARAFALTTLDRLLRKGVDGRRGAAHAIGEDGKAEFSCLGADEAALAVACLDAFEATRNKDYLKAARKSAERLGRRLRDEKTGAYLDRALGDGKAPPPLGRLSDPLRPVTDTPGPSLNAMATEMHWRLAKHLGEAEHATRARAVVRAFGKILGRVGPAVPSLVLIAERMREEKP